MSYEGDDGIDMGPEHPDWPKRPDGTPMTPGAAAAFLRGKGQKASGGDGARRSKSDGPGQEYAEVKERIPEFYARYPTGAVVTSKVKIIEASFARGNEAVMVQAKAYRTPDDPHPGVGTSWMVIPGHTPYTNGSEVENAETSAWGRAIAAVGIKVDKGIASADEIRGKTDGDLEQPSRVSAPALALAAAAIEAAGLPTGEPESVSIGGDTAPGPVADPAVAPVAPVGTGEDAKPRRRAAAKPDPGPAPVEDQKETTETAAPVEAVSEDPPVAEATPSGLTYDEFKSMAREKFIPNGEIQRVARNLVEKGTIQQVGGVKDLSDAERFTLFMMVIAEQGE